MMTLKDFYRQKAVPLSLGLLLRFAIVIIISSAFSSTDAADVLVWMSISSLVVISVLGRMTTAKTRFLENKLSIDQVEVIFHTVLQRLFLGLISLIFIGCIVCIWNDTKLQTAAAGICYGFLLVLHNQFSLFSEIKGQGCNRYWIIVAELLVALISFYLGFAIEFFLVRFSLLIVQTELWRSASCINNNKSGLPSFKNPLSRVELATTCASGIELPLIHLVGTSGDTIAFAILSRFYGSISTLYGQISRPYWASGGIAQVTIFSTPRYLDVNALWLATFLIALFSSFTGQQLLYPVDTSAPIAQSLLLFSLFATLNRYRKNLLLHSGAYESRADKIAAAYFIYGLALVVFLLCESTIQLLLFSKVALAFIVLLLTWR